MHTLCKAVATSLLSAALAGAPLFAQNPPQKGQNNGQNHPQKPSNSSSSRPNHAQPSKGANSSRPQQPSRPQGSSRPQQPSRPQPARPQGPSRPQGPARPQRPSRPWHPPTPPNYHGRYVSHSNWRRGYRLPPGDWSRGMVITNYGYYHLQPPPVGYQWRYIDGNFVLAAVATGIIASVLIGALGQ